MLNLHDFILDFSESGDLTKVDLDTVTGTHNE